MPTRRERIEGGLLGLLIGDAVGVPYEFHAPELLPPREQIEMTPPANFSRAHTGVPPGTWSDDGAQALCLLASLLECDGFDADDFGERLVQWYLNGYLAVDNIVFDVGITSAAAIRRIREGVPALEAGPDAQYDNGNGSLMRALPLALWHRGPDADLVSLAHAQSCVTHGHWRSRACCALYCLWARRVLDGHPEPWQDAVATLRELYRKHGVALEELDAHICPEREPGGTGSGYVVDSLHSARWALRESTFEGVVKSAIVLGHDTDTTACIAAGIAGLRDGVEAIPQRWDEALRGKELLQPLLEKLLQLQAE
jgi:ADP-ribosylglycohydrolase